MRRITASLAIPLGILVLLPGTSWAQKKSALQDTLTSVRERLKYSARADAALRICAQIEKWPLPNGRTVKDFLDRHIAEGEFKDYFDAETQVRARARTDIVAFLRDARRVTPLRFFSSGECDIDVEVGADFVIKELQRLADAYGGKAVSGSDKDYAGSDFDKLLEDKKDVILDATGSGRPSDILQWQQRLKMLLRESGRVSMSSLRGGGMGGRGMGGGGAGPGRMGGMGGMGGGRGDMGRMGGGRMGGGRMGGDPGMGGMGGRPRNMGMGRGGVGEQKATDPLRAIRAMQKRPGWELVSKEGIIRSQKAARQCARQFLWHKVVNLKLRGGRTVRDFLDADATMAKAFKTRVEEVTVQKQDESGPFPDRIYSVTLTLAMRDFCRQAAEIEKDARSDAIVNKIIATYGQGGKLGVFGIEDFAEIGKLNPNKIADGQMVGVGHASAPEGEVKEGPKPTVAPIAPPDWATGKPLVADGRAQLPAGESDTLVARQLAMTEGLCKLIDKINLLILPDKRSVANFFEAHPAAKFDLATHLTSARIRRPQVNWDQRIATMDLELTLERVWRIIRHFATKQKEEQT